MRLPEIYRTRFPRLDALDLDRVALDRPRPSGKFAECVGAEWRQTKYGHRLRLMVQFATAESGGTREYWPPPGSVRILFRVHGSDLILWPDRFDLPLTIARDVMNPTTKVRSDRVWVAPADLWPCAQVDGGASLGSNQ